MDSVQLPTQRAYRWFTHLLPPPAEYPSKIGLGSVGRDILCFLPVGVAGFCSAALLLLTLIRGAEALRLNQALGRERNCVNPDDGELDRGKPRKAGDVVAVEGSCGLNVLPEDATPPRRGAIQLQQKEK